MQICLFSIACFTIALIYAFFFKVHSIFPASSVQAVSVLLTLLQASINSLRATGVDVFPQTDEKMENLNGLIEHLQQRSREGTLRSDRDMYALVAAGGDIPGKKIKIQFYKLYAGSSGHYHS